MSPSAGRTGVALVTGASRGIGRAVALELARRGYEVVATMRDPAAGADLPGRAEEAGGSLRVAALDVRRPAAEAVPDGLSVLVNNAGIEAAYLPVEAAPLSMWREVFETNVFGLLAVTRLAIPVMRDGGGGVICNVTSSSILAPVPFYAAYRASKAAVGALGESLRAELAPFGIRVVEIMPGPIATDMYAASERVPEAAELEPYRDMALAMARSRGPIADMVCPPEEAAVAIADAIADESGPLRYGCDPLSVGMLESWRSSSDEEYMAGMLRAFDPG